MIFTFRKTGVIIIARNESEYQDIAAKLNKLGFFVASPIYISALSARKKATKVFIETLGSMKGLTDEIILINLIDNSVSIINTDIEIKRGNKKALRLFDKISEKEESLQIPKFPWERKVDYLINCVKYIEWI